MDITQSKLIQSAHAYRGIYEQFVTDASFLWHLRSISINQPNFYVDDQIRFESRIDAQLDGLMTSVELGWECCEEALEIAGPGEHFTASVTAFRSHEVQKIQKVVETGLKSPLSTKGLVSAMGWLSSGIVEPWLEKLLNGKDLNHKYLGIAACSVRRKDPGEVLSQIIKREDCRAHLPLYARMLRLVGELRRQDLMPALQQAEKSKDPAIVFWSLWSMILLGQTAIAKNLQPFVIKPNIYQSRASSLAFRVLPIEQARDWISAMAKNPELSREVIKATSNLGDPHAVNWLITKMEDSALARLAGESFTNITGIDLQQHQVSKKSISNIPTVPNDEPNDHNVGLDEDENLIWPDPEKVAALWRSHGSNFMVGRRYFLGKPISSDWLKRVIAEGNMRQRHAATLELALLDPQTRLINTYAKVIP